ncbi:HipA N-terminal domain-containing protein [Paenarthrobacter sp.]|uniref:HipA N-terminal domain-containing protein n=1 Tax=Paenarthrobacter sp. TaxID=1931993 RepID=UPI0035C67A8F
MQGKNSTSPEGQVRSHLAKENSLSTPDAFGLLRVLGADCAGAVQVLPPGEAPEVPGAVIPMTGHPTAAAYTRKTSPRHWRSEAKRS